MEIPKLRKWRERRGLTQKELAELAGVSLRGIAGYEAGQGIRPNTARKVADALEIAVEDLLDLAHAAGGSYPPALEMPDEQFEVLVREADESGLSEMMDDVGRYLPRRGEERGRALAWRSVVAINRCVFIARERKARADAELEKLEKLQIA